MEHSTIDPMSWKKCLPAVQVILDLWCIIHGIYGLKVIKKLFLTFPSVFEKSFIKKSSKNNTTKENQTFVCTTQRKLTVKFSQEDVCFQGNSNLPSTWAYLRKYGLKSYLSFLTESNGKIRPLSHRNGNCAILSATSIFCQRNSEEHFQM